jgi:hypothetical protein
MTKRALLAGAVIAALAAGAMAQQLSSITLTGNEVVTAALGGPGGSSIFVPISQLRNAQGATTTALTTGTINLTTATATLITTAAVSGALTLNTPTAPWDGEIFELANGSGSANTATVTLTASTGQTVNGGAVATQASQASAEWRYVAATTTWYRLR